MLAAIKPTTTAAAPVQQPAVPARRLIADATGEDMRLAALAFDGDETAFEAIYADHKRAVAATARMFVRDTAQIEDIVQQTFLMLVTRAGQLCRRPVRLRAWLLTVARNAAIDVIRTRRIEHVSLDHATHLAGGETACEAALGRLQSKALRSALAGLAPEQRDVLVQHFIEGYRFVEIATRSGVPVGTVKSRAALGLAHLRRNGAL